jgi:hypothetical protein
MGQGCHAPRNRHTVAYGRDSRVSEKEHYARAGMRLPPSTVALRNSRWRPVRLPSKLSTKFDGKRNHAIAPNGCPACLR